eukprot:11616666-Prorocentrum_lima.AAC.1
MLGPDDSNDKTGFLLNRPISWEKDRLPWECDPRQIELAVAELGLSDARPKATPGAKVTLKQRQEAAPLPPQAVKAYRSAAARIGFIAHD